MDPHTTHSSRGLQRIVLLEDEPFLADLVQAIVRAWDRRVDLVVFADGNEAWNALCRQEPDLFITDGNHPGLDGLEILRRLARRKAGFPIVWSGYPAQAPGSDEEVANLKVCLLPKPYSLEQLVQTLDELLGRRNNPSFRQNLESCLQQLRMV